MSAAWVSREVIENQKRKRQQLPSGVRGIGADDRFLVYWRDPNGRLRQERIKLLGKPGKRLADRRAELLTAQLTLGTYEDKDATTWATFRAEYEQKKFDGKRSSTQKRYRETMTLFEEICRPKLVRAITTKTIDDFCVGLRKRRGTKSTSMLPSTVNKHLRHLKAILHRAVLWQYLPAMPEIEMMDEPEKAPRYMLPEHFTAIYEKCDAAAVPVGRPYSPGDWWQALIVTALMTGMRIGELLCLRWEDVELDKAFLRVHYGETKGKRDEIIPLHPVVVEHLKRIQDYSQLVFDWPHSERTLSDEFHRVQRAAGIKLPCRENHEHTATCHVYGFHSLKKACGTLNAARLPEAVLNAFMRHSSINVTRKFYQNRTGVLEGCLDSMYVPDVAVKSDEKTD